MTTASTSRRSFLGRCLAGAVLAAARWLPVPEPPAVVDLRSQQVLATWMRQYLADLWTPEAVQLLRDMHPRRR